MSAPRPTSVRLGWPRRRDCKLPAVRILFLSTLFPDASRPTFGIHNASLVRRLAVPFQVSVVAPRPRLSAFLRRPGAGVAESCPEDAALTPVFPTVPYLPKIGSAVNHRLVAAWLNSTVRGICQAQKPDLLLSAWAYPDACAALRLAEPLGLPCVVIVQGTDIHEYLRYPVRRGIILRHLRHAAAIVTRSEDLRLHLLAAGLPATHVQTLYNGVDTDLFCPAADRESVRRELGLTATDAAVLFVGNFVPVKNPLLAVQAVAALKDQYPSRRWRLFMIGAGPLRAETEALAAAALGDAVSFAGVCSQAQVARHMQAADVLCVPSRNEGTPNVIREALACGLPVVATRVGGIPELLTDPRIGELVDPSQPAAMSSALARAVASGPRSDACRRQALAFSWDETIRRYTELFAAIMAGRSVGGRSSR